MTILDPIRHHFHILFLVIICLLSAQNGLCMTLFSDKWWEEQQTRANKEFEKIQRKKLKQIAIGPQNLKLYPISLQAAIVDHALDQFFKCAGNYLDIKVAYKNIKKLQERFSSESLKACFDWRFPVALSKNNHCLTYPESASLDLIRKIQLENSSQILDISEDLTKLAIVSQKPKYTIVQIFTLVSGKFIPEAEFFFDQNISSLNFSHDGEYLAAGTLDGCVSFINMNLTANEKIYRIKLFDEQIRKVTWSHDSRFFVAHTMNKSALVQHKNDNGKRTFSHNHDFETPGPDIFSGDGNWYTTQSTSKLLGHLSLLLYNRSNDDKWLIYQEFVLGKDHTYSNIAFSPDSKYIAAVSTKRSNKFPHVTWGYIHLWFKHAQLPIFYPNRVFKYRGDIIDIAFSPHISIHQSCLIAIVIKRHYDSLYDAFVYDTESGKTMFSIRNSKHDKFFFSSDGSSLVFGNTIYPLQLPALYTWCKSITSGSHRYYWTAEKLNEMLRQSDLLETLPKHFKDSLNLIRLEQTQAESSLNQSNAPPYAEMPYNHEARIKKKSAGFWQSMLKGLMVYPLFGLLAYYSLMPQPMNEQAGLIGITGLMLNVIASKLIFGQKINPLKFKNLSMITGAGLGIAAGFPITCAIGHSLQHTNLNGGISSHV